MRELSLFTGVGGGLLGTKLLGWTCVCAVEIEPYCQEVLVRRQADGWLDPFPIWPNVRTFDGTAWRGRVDVVTAGFPCQPFSVAGKRRGADDERNGWPDTARIIGEVRPRYALLENVPGLLDSGYFGRVLGDLADLGYDATWGVFSASGSGAPHPRRRLWMVAHANGAGLEGVHAPIGRDLVQPASRDVRRKWHPEPELDRVAYRVPHWVDRIRAVGNAQVPRVVARAWRALS